jgi:hypothetical protein
VVVVNKKKPQGKNCRWIPISNEAKKYNGRIRWVGPSISNIFIEDIPDPMDLEFNSIESAFSGWPDPYDDNPSYPAY